jgi:hypothetical protein
MVNASRSSAGGCGNATTVGFISRGGLARHGAFADDIYLAESRERSLAVNGRRKARAFGRRVKLRVARAAKRLKVGLGKCVV